MKALVVLLILLTLLFNVYVLSEAFGFSVIYSSNPTSMDKWQNSIPFVISLDVIVGSLVLVFLGNIKSNRNRRI